MKVSKQSKNGFAFFGLVFGLVTMAIVFYFGVILISPKLPPIPFVSASSIDLNTKDDENDLRNRIQVEKIGIGNRINDLMLVVSPFEVSVREGIIFNILSLIG